MGVYTVLSEEDSKFYSSRLHIGVLRVMLYTPTHTHTHHAFKRFPFPSHLFQLSTAICHVYHAVMSVQNKTLPTDTFD